MPRLLLFSVLVLCVAQTPLFAEEPLHQRIDKIVNDARIGPPAPIVSDAEFLRRVSLDLAGVIPTSKEAREFLEDKDPQKRVQLIDRLLASPQYVRHATDWLHITLMERRTNDGAWLTFLKTSVEQNNPWNQLAEEIFAYDGTDAKKRGPINYFTARSVEPNLMTREVSRMFFGMDLQCAQCHDHPLIDDYYQADYYGVFAFLSRTYLFQPDKKKPAVLAEKAEGDAKFKSVFTQEEGATRPRLPGDEQIAEPTFKKGEEYKVKPDKKKKKIRPIPKYSRRERLALLLAEGKNESFRRNIVNRLWARMMGRGLVHPPDLHHAANPPSHPKLLDLLAREFATTMKFDIKALLRELALSQTYQRSVSLPENLIQQAQEMTPRLAELEAQRKRLKTQQSEIGQALIKARSDRSAAQKTLSTLQAELKKAGVAAAEAKRQHEGFVKALVESQQQLAMRQSASEPLKSSAEKAKQALKLLAGDRELIAISTKLEERTKKLVGEISALTTSIAQRTAEVSAASQKLAPARQLVEKLEARLAANNKQIESVNAHVKALASQQSTAMNAVPVARRRIKTVKAYLEYVARSQSAQASRLAAENMLVELRPYKKETEQSRGRLAQEQQAHSEATKARDEAAQLLADIERQLAVKPVVADALQEASAKVALAQQRLPQDAELSQLLQQIQSKSQTLTKEVVDLQQALPERQSQVQAATEQITKSREQVDRLTKSLEELQQRVAALSEKAGPLTETAEKDQAALDETYNKLTQYWSEQFVIGSLEPLTPEQMAWSVMRATGFIEKQRAASAAQINKKKPLKAEEQQDPKKVAAREKEIESAADKELQKNVALFIKLFSASAGQPQHDFFATAEQALFFANGGQLRSWLAPGSGNLTERLIKMENTEELAEELYLSVLTRRPTNEEQADVAEYLSARPKEKNAAIRELVWALITSSEFRFHH